MRTVSREEVYKMDNSYWDVMDGEYYHDHEIILDSNDILRWKPDPLISKLSPSGRLACIDLNKLFGDGASKNDPFVRELYRKMGYSLSGYWEIFYWEVNNDLTDEWDPDRFIKEEK